MRHKIVEEDLQLIAAAGIPWDRFANKTVLISGANGFLPSYMVEVLLYLNELRAERQTNVIGLNRSFDKASLRFAHYQGRHDFEVIVQDVCEPVVTDHKIDFVIHAASQASPKHFGGDPVGTMLANLLGTQNLLRLAKDKGAEGFLFLSSGEVYGEVDQQKVPTKETDYGYLDPMAVRSCYAESKRAAETLCMAWLQQYGVPARIVRPFHTYGPGMNLDDGRVHADFVADIVNDRDLTLHSDGSAVRTFCYIADATRAFFTVLLCGEAGEAYNVGNETAKLTIRQLAETLVKLIPEKGLRVVEKPRTESKYIPSTAVLSVPDTAKLRNLGWEPRFSAEEGFRRTIESFV